MSGHQAMVIDRPKPPEPCEVRVCEQRVGKECWKEYCTTHRELERILRGTWPNTY
jgi:hypothetical protein